MEDVTTAIRKFEVKRYQNMAIPEAESITEETSVKKKKSFKTEEEELEEELEIIETL
jgi:hypothetical protein